MIPEELQAIRERVNKATLGPWRTNVEFRIARVNDGSNPYWKPTNIADGKCYWCESHELIGTTTRNGANFHVHGDIPDNQTVVSPSALETVIPDCGMKEEDAEFIAYAREDLPNAINYIEHLESENQRLHGLLDDITRCHDDEGFRAREIARQGWECENTASM